MKKFLSVIGSVVILTGGILAQTGKGVDTQTQKIRQDTSNGKQIDTTTGRGFSFGKGKTKVRELLPNPYRLASRRDVLVDSILNALKEKKLLVDDAASRVDDGVIITTPFVFARGAVIARTELNRYAILPDTATVWRSGRYSLRIDVQSIDGIQNNVTVVARVDGKSENGISTEWTSVTSSGLAEDEFLSKLIELVTGKSPDEPQNTEEIEKPE